MSYDLLARHARVEHNKSNGDTLCDSIHVNVNNLSVPLIKWSDSKCDYN